MVNIIVLTGIIREETSWALLFAKGLAKHDLNVTVISGYPNYNYDPLYREHQLNHPDERVSKNLRIIRVGSKRKEKSSLFFRFLRYISLTFAIKKELSKHEAEFLYIYSTPPFLGLLGKVIGRSGCQSVYIAQDLFPDNLFAIKPILEHTIFGRLLRAIEKKIYNSCSHIVTISETMKDSIISTGVPSNKITVIYNWADVESMYPVQRNDNILFDEYGIDRNKFIVSYAGNIGPFQRIDVLLDVAKKLNGYSDIEIVIFGRGSCKNSLEERIFKEGITNVLILPLQNPNRISNVYSFGDLEYVSVGPGVMKMASPHKILDIMAVGKPLLAAIDKQCDVASLITEQQMGVVVSCDADEIASAILHAYTNRERVVKMGQAARAYAERINYDSQIKRYVNLISEQ